MVAQLNSLYVKTRPLKAVVRLMSYALFEGRPLTTRGRWINPLVFLNFRLLRALSIRKRVRKPVFIVGVGRSGTTILGILLSMHRDVGFLNEPKALWHSIFPREDVIGSYGGEDALYRLDGSFVTRETREGAHSLFGAWLRFTGSGRVVDKYPELIFRIPFVKEIFPDAKFIFIVRNGWDSCRSIEKWSKGHSMAGEAGSRDWWGLNNRKWGLMLDQVVRGDEMLGPVFDRIAAYTDHRHMALVEWIVTMREGLSRIREYGGDIEMVKYERLLQNPEGVLADILAFCELENDPEVFNYARKVMRAPTLHGAMDIPDEIRPAFEDTMQRLGWD